MNKNRELKKDDVNRIRSCFYQTDVLTKQDLRKKTGISSGGITNILQELLEAGEIRRMPDAASTGGRRPKRFQLNPDYAHIGTINCHRNQNRYYFETDIYACNGIHLSGNCAFYEEGSAEHLKEAGKSLLVSDPRIRILAISIPGFSQHGIVGLCDFHDLEGKDLKSLMGGELPVIIENDVNVACIGFYQERKSQNMALIYQPDAEYSGTGLILNGRLYNGSGHKAGEMRFLYQSRPAAELADPAEELWREICAVQAVVDPEVIGWSSDITTENELRKYRNGNPLPLVHIENMKEVIQRGLAAIGRDVLLKQGGPET